MSGPRRGVIGGGVVLGLVLALAPASLAHAQSMPRYKSFPAASAARVGNCRPVAPVFHSEPTIKSFGTCVSRRARRVGRGYLLVTPRRIKGVPHALMILNNAGHLVWYMRRDHKVRDLKVVEYQGRPMLAWHEALAKRHHVYYLMDQSYRIVRSIDVGGGMKTDMHELQITPQGTALLGAQPFFRRHGKKLQDQVIREIDLATGAVIFQWRARDHVPLSASYFRRPGRDGVVDFFHGNSIRLTPDGNLLVSARNTSAVYKIDRRTGRIIWTLGGRRDSFDLVSKHPRWQFCHQHDVTQLPNGHILLFDDGASYKRSGCPSHTARAQEFALLPHHRVKLVRQFRSETASPDGRGYMAWYVGSARRESNGDTLVSWGNLPQITEFDSRGRINFGLTLANWTYRAVRARWDGVPVTKPAIAARRGPNGLTVWASWNGATRVRSWTLLLGATPHALAPAGPPKPRSGFETTIASTAAARYAAVRANDRDGKPLGVSNVVAVGVPAGG